MFKIILSLLLNRAKTAEWQLQIGAYLLKKGCGFELGKVVDEQKLGAKRYNIKRVVGLTYHFGSKKIRPLMERKNIRLK